MILIWSMEWMDGERPVEWCQLVTVVPKAGGTDRHTAMYAEDLVVDDHAQREIIKHIGEVVPDIGIAVFSRTLGVKSV